MDEFNVENHINSIISKKPNPLNKNIIIGIIILVIIFGFIFSSNINITGKVIYNEPILRNNEILPGIDSNYALLENAKSNTIVDISDGGKYEISADIIKKNINGKEIIMYGYNGMIPGPALRVKQGSKINVLFKNNIDMDTTIHWHGLRHDIKNDGVPGISQDPISPGESFTYELYFPDDGIYWYHPHVREDIQQDSGLSGNMLVTPSNAYNLVNREELLMLDDILLDDNGQIVPFGKDHTNFAVMGRYGNIMLTNGETKYNLNIDKGEVVRFYITNVANVRPYNFNIKGAKMKLVGGDLGQFEKEEFIDSIIIAPAMRYIIDVYFEESGIFNLMNTNPKKSYILGSVTVSKDLVDNSYLEEFNNNLINREVIEDIAKYEKYFDKPVDYNLDLTVDLGNFMESMASLPCHIMGGIVMGDCNDEERAKFEAESVHEKISIEWEDEMNMKVSGEDVEWIIKDRNSKEKNMDINMEANVGDIVKIRLFNDPNSIHPMQHPIHLHGQRFIVTEIDGKLVDNKVWSDTVLVPIGTTIDILIDVTNPGEWMMHCHIAEHLESGMMTSFNVMKGGTN